MAPYLMSRILCFTALTSFLISTTVFADEPIKGRVETNLRAGHERSIFMTEFWVPFAQSDSKDNVLYGSLRMMGDNQDNREGNLGVGYRQAIDTNGFKGLVGVHGWLDRRITQRGSKTHQLTGGLEWLGESVDVRLNGYIPLSDKREIEIPNTNPQGPALVGTGIVVDTNGAVLEEPQGGFDLELGLELGQYSEFIRDNTDSFRVYVGGYYFDGPNTENVAGWRTRFTADVTENIQFGARFQRDDERGAQGFLEATFRFPFGHKKSYRKEGIRARLDESPERDIDIVTNEVVTDTGDRVQVLNQTTGTAQEVLHVDNTAAGGGDGSAENPFNTLSDAQTASSAHSIIYVAQGDGADTNQDQGIVLNQTGQQLIGSGANFVYDAGKFTTANGASPTSILIAPATAAPVISNGNVNGDGITVSADNITVAGITVDGSNRDGIVVEADGAAASAQNITIQNVTTQNNRHGIYIYGANDGAVSAKVQSAVTTSNSQHGIAVYDDTDDTFTADLGGGEMGSTGNNVLAGNTLEDLAVEYDGRALAAQNNWWGQASGPDTDAPDVGVSPQIYYGAPINDGLVGHWTFDNEWTTNTTAYDRSGQGNDGALNGGLSLADQVTGQNRQALDFDGVGYYIDTTPNPVNSGTGQITVLVLASPDYSSSNGSIREILRHEFDVGLGNGGYLLEWRDDLVSDIWGFGLSQSNGTSRQPYRPSVAQFPSGVYTHLAFTGDGTDVRGYSNASFQSSIGYDGTIANGRDVLIGGYSTNGNSKSRFFDGMIDDIRIYDRALSATEISELYRTNTSSAVNAGGFLTAAP